MRPLVSTTLMTVCATVGCDSNKRQPDNEPLRTRNAAVYAAVETDFAEAVYCKPDAASADPKEVQLAPLIVQAASSDSPASSGQVRLAAILDFTNGDWLLDTSRPTVYYTVAKVTIRRREVEQRVYFWCYARLVDSAEMTRSNQLKLKNPRFRGFRMTLDQDGFPLVWEVLGDLPPPARIFVAEHLENDACQAFGASLPGRRYCTETAMAEHPDVVVARVLQAGPEPMGPIYYLTNDLNVTTLICRCMPSQFNAVAEQIEYAALPFETLGKLTHRVSKRLFPIPQMQSPPWLEGALRWPPSN